MKRDLELIRTILLNAEADKYQYGANVYVDGIQPTICAHHVALILDAGLAEGRVIKSDAYGIVAGQIDRLTNAGHDFCEGIRQDTIWRKVREKIIKPGAAHTISAVIEMVKIQVQKQIFPEE